MSDKAGSQSGGDETLTDSNSGLQTMVANRYRLREMLGRGSYGQVYRADDTKFTPPRVVALKLLYPSFTSDDKIRDEIKKEAGSLALFNHPNILRVLDFEIGDQHSFIVTEFAGGGSLSKKLADQPGNYLPLDQVKYFLEKLCGALDQAHAKGIIHRDIKPQNILLDTQGVPLLADFGISAAASTSSASLVDVNPSGTPLYMAPELWQGQVSKASDIYAMGVLLFQMLSGKTPYQGNTHSLAFSHCNAPIPSLIEQAPWLSNYPALDRVLMRVLAKSPRERYRTARELNDDFLAALNSGPRHDQTPPVTWPPPWNPVPPVQAPPTVTYYPNQLPPVMPQPPRQTNRGILLVLGFLGFGVLAIVALVVFFLLQNSSLTETLTINPAATATVTSMSSPTAVTGVVLIPSATAITSNLALPTQVSTTTIINTTTSALPTPAPTAAPTSNTKPAQGKVGDTLKLQNFQLTLNQIQRSDKASDGKTAAPTNYQYVFVEVTYVSAKAENLFITLSYHHPYLRDSQNFIYSYDNSDNKKPAFDGDLKPGDKVKGWLTYLVPVSASGLVFYFDLKADMFEKGGSNVFEVLLDDSSATTAAKAPDAAPQVAGPEGKVGDWIGTNRYAFQIAKFEPSASIPRMGFTLTPEAGKKFFTAEVIIQGNSDARITANYNQLTLKDAEGFRYTFTPTSLPRFLFDELPRGYKFRGWVSFEVPATATGLRLEYALLVTDTTPLQINTGL